MVIVRCNNCGEVIIDTKRKVNRVAEIISYSLVFRDEIGKFELDLEPENTEYVCTICGSKINTEKLNKLGISIKVLIRKAEGGE